MTHHQIPPVSLTRTTPVLSPSESRPGSSLRSQAIPQDTFTRASTPTLLNWHESIPFVYHGPSGPEHFTIERAGPRNFAQEDDKRIFQLQRQADHEPIPALKDIPFRLEQDFNAPNAYTLLVRDAQGQVVGVSKLSPMESYFETLSNTAMLGSLVVKPEHQGKGIAKKLVTMCTTAAKPLGYEYALLYTQNPAVEGTPDKPGLAPQNGFQKLGYDTHYRWFYLPLQSETLSRKQQQLFENNLKAAGVTITA